MASVAVLLCTYNGGSFLTEQLASIGAQDFTGRSIRLEVHASDDGSTDATSAVLNEWKGTCSAALVSRRCGPGKGHAANFLSLVAAPEISADYYAYSDQDDIWDSDKLERALTALERVPAGIPALYCARTRSISARGKATGKSPLFSRPPSFSNALLQNIAGGNTMVMNAAARQLLATAGSVDVVSHDWWTYLLVAGAGGRVMYDAEPCLSYRQHEGNVIGDSLGTGSRLRRYKRFLHGRNRDWYTRNITALKQNMSLLTPENCSILEAFEQAREANLINRVRALTHSGVYAQTAIGQLGLYTATLLKKI
ncbi:glycosyltransferase family 2 protein [Haliea sp. E17]|uniref:glycosyltransferase family 2 protein n=1 Tax=Haliea sp. E17 TaxID=3401576 RepID=UPI003AB099CE